MEISSCQMDAFFFSVWMCLLEFVFYIFNLDIHEKNARDSMTLIDIWEEDNLRKDHHGLTRGKCIIMSQNFRALSFKDLTIDELGEEYLLRLDHAILKVLRFWILFIVNEDIFLLLLLRFFYTI